MRVVVVGASGNVGTSLLAALADEPAVESVLGVARRTPTLEVPKTEWVEADIAKDDLVRLFRGASVVAHLAWAIQPSRDLNALWRTNVMGSRRLFRAVADAGVAALVYASSVGAYSPGPKDRFVDESWPTNGIETSFYSRHKAEVERELDRFEQQVPGVRVVRMRPGLIFKRDAASGIRRLFAGPFFPSPLAKRGRVPFLPNVPQLRFQAVHSLDVGEAFRLAILGEARGPLNLAAEPVLDPPKLAELLDARLVTLAPGALRALAAGSWTLRLQPSPPGWVDLGLQVPLLDTARAREELGWTPSRGADEAFCELVEGLRHGDGLETPPLSPATGGVLRIRELLTGVGGRE